MKGIGQRGQALLETVVVLGLMTAAALVTMAALVTSSIANRSLDSGDVAFNLVKTQFEDIKNKTYSTSTPPCYNVSVEAPSGYAVTISAVYLDANLNVSTTDTKLQRVTVTATRSAATLLSLEMFKANLGGASASGCQ